MQPETDKIRSETRPPGWWFVFHEDKLLVRMDKDSVSIPFIDSLSGLGLIPSWELKLGSWGGNPCYAGLVDGNGWAAENMEFQGLRGLFGRLDEAFFGMAGRALQRVRWDSLHQFCSRCGSRADTRGHARR